MPEEVDEDDISRWLESALTSIKEAIQSGHKFVGHIPKLVESIQETLKLSDDVPINRPTISARACIVCGRDDMPGQQRKSGFKCNTCVGVPSANRFRVQVEQYTHAEKGFDEDGSKMLNNYVILRNLGRGSYGKVKMAVHAVSNQPYAVKILDKATLRKHTGEGDPFSAIMREIKILKHLQHPHIIKMVEVIDDTKENKLYIVTEYLSGGPICTIEEKGVVTSNNMTIGRIQKHAMGIASGLQYLHQKGIIHRDIKPDNLLIDVHDNVKLSDFGVSSAFGAGQDILVDTQGSPAFLCPEAFSGGKKLGRAADVWAFGVTLYCLVFHKLPFSGKDLEELRASIETHNPPIEHPNKHVVDLLQNMLCKDPVKRLTVDQIMSHPFVSSIRMVKGIASQTTRLHLAVASPSNEFSVPKGVDGVIFRMPDASDEGESGIEEMLKFFMERGNQVQVVRAAPYQMNFYTPKTKPETDATEETVKVKLQYQGALTSDIMPTPERSPSPEPSSSSHPIPQPPSGVRLPQLRNSLSTTPGSTTSARGLGESKSRLKPQMVASNSYGIPTTEDEMRKTFDRVDVEGSGWITVQDFMDLCANFDDMGLPKGSSFTRVVNSVSHHGILNYEEFSLLILRLLQR